MDGPNKIVSASSPTKPSSENKVVKNKSQGTLEVKFWIYTESIDNAYLSLFTTAKYLCEAYNSIFSISSFFGDFSLRLPGGYGEGEETGPLAE